MKQLIALLAASMVFLSCSKEDLLQPENSSKNNFSKQDIAVVEGAYASPWEQYATWNKKDEDGYSIFWINRSTPQLTQEVIDEGLVLTYAKVGTAHPQYQSFTKPVLMPFYYLPPNERPNANTFYFYDATAPGQVTIAYKVQFTKSDSPQMGGDVDLNDFEVQYIVLTKKFLDDRGLNRTTVRNYYTYDQVMALVDPK